MTLFKTKYKYLDNFLLGILAGAAIGLGGFLNLLLVSTGIEALRYLGGFVFSIGLFTVCFFGLHLYTGKIGYVMENDRSFALSLLIMYLGNVIGAVGFGYLMHLTGVIQDTATTVALNKIVFDGETGSSPLKILLYSFFCCIMVFLAVDVYKKSNNWFIKICNLVICVALFVITGMEHCVANMFYFAFANVYSSHFLNAFLALLIATAGNSLGAISTYLVVNAVNRK